MGRYLFPLPRGPCRSLLSIQTGLRRLLLEWYLWALVKSTLYCIYQLYVGHRSATRVRTAKLERLKYTQNIDGKASWEPAKGNKNHNVMCSCFTFLILKKTKVSLCDSHAVCVSVSSLPLINFRILERIFTRFDIYIVPPELISVAYFINPSHQSVCLYLYPSYRC
jgi:hypothetical protein